MRIALVDSTPRPRVYPLALLKIGAWKKACGDTCTLFDNVLPDAGDFDEIWVTTTFTFDIPYAAGIVKEAWSRADVVRVGGVSATLFPEVFRSLGADVHLGLLSEAEKFSPDYSLLPAPPEYSITHTSRGCIRKCGFCMVPKLEPCFKDRDHWRDDVHPQTKKILFFDNNWLAKGADRLKGDIAIIRDIVDSGQVTQIDFNQGLDARLVNEKMAMLLKGLPIGPVRFAFDGMHEDGHYQRAVRLMASKGHKNFMTYVLYNFTDAPQDFYYRLKQSVLLAAELGVSVGSFPMRYQPIMQIDSARSYVGPKWTETKKKGFMNILNKQSIGGAVTFSDVESFEYWFGRSGDEFNKLLSYPKLNQLMARKKGALRMNRAREVERANG